MQRTFEERASGFAMGRGLRAFILAAACVLGLVMLTGGPRVAHAQFGIPNIVFGGGNVYIGHGGYRRGYSRRGYSRRSYSRRSYTRRSYVDPRHARRGGGGGGRDGGGGGSSAGLGKATGSGGVKVRTTD